MLAIAIAAGVLGYDPNTYSSLVTLHDDTGAGIYYVLDANAGEGTADDVCDTVNGRPVESIEECAYINDKFIDLGPGASQPFSAPQFTIRGCYLVYDEQYTNAVYYNGALGPLNYYNPAPDATSHVRVICRAGVTAPPAGDYYDILSTGSPTVAPTMMPSTSYPTLLPTEAPTETLQPLEEWHGELCAIAGCNNEHRLTIGDDTKICFVPYDINSWNGQTLVDTPPESCPVCEVTSNVISDRFSATSTTNVAAGLSPVREIHASCDSYPCELFPEQSCNQMFCVWDEQRGLCREPDFNIDPIAKINFEHQHIHVATYTNAKGESISLTPGNFLPDPPFLSSPFEHLHDNRESRPPNISYLIDQVFFNFEILDNRFHIEVSNPALFCSSFSAHSLETVQFYAEVPGNNAEHLPTVQRITSPNQRIDYKAFCDEAVGGTEDFYIDIVPDCVNIRRDFNCSKFGCRDPFAIPDPNIQMVLRDTPSRMRRCEATDRASYEDANRITLIQIARSGIDPAFVPTEHLHTHSPVTSTPSVAPTTPTPTHEPTKWQAHPAHECNSNGAHIIDPTSGFNSYYLKEDLCNTGAAFFNRNGSLQRCVKQNIPSHYYSNTDHACLTCSTSRSGDTSCYRESCSRYSYNLTECILNWCVATPDGGCREPDHSTNLFNIIDTDFEGGDRQNSETIAHIKKIYLNPSSTTTVREAGSSPSYVYSSQVDVNDIVNGQGLLLERAIPGAQENIQANVSFKNTQLHNSYRNPIISFLDACASMYIEHIDGTQFFGDCGSYGLFSQPDDVAAVKFTTGDEMYRELGESNPDHRFFLVHFELQTLAPTSLPTESPTKKPTTEPPYTATLPPSSAPTARPTETPTTYLEHFCKPQGEEVCPSSLPFILAGDDAITQVTMHVLAPVLPNEDSGYHFCQTPGNTQDNAGNLLCLGCNVNGNEADGYVRTCDPIHCNALTQTGCEQSPVCTFSETCQYIDSEDCTPVRLTLQDTPLTEIVGLESSVRPDLNIAMGAASQNMLCRHQIKYISEVLVRNKSSTVVSGVPARSLNVNGQIFSDLFEPVERGTSPTRAPPPQAPTPPPPTLQCDLVTDRVECVSNQACTWFGQLDRCERYDYNVPRLKEQIELRDELSDLYLTLFIVTVGISGLFSILHAYDVWRFCRNKPKPIPEEASMALPPPVYKSRTSTKSLL